MTKVSLLTYGIGNIRSVARALQASGADVELISSPSEVANAERLVLPGVGAFSSCYQALSEHNLLDSIHDFFRHERPFLGICVGMQLMFDHSEEFGHHSGFGLINGHVTLLPSQPGLKLPSVGWRSVNFTEPSLNGLDLSDKYYLIHSFYCECDNSGDISATYMYGNFCATAAVVRGPWHGVQFHPEKSGQAGITFLSEFLSF